MTLEELHLIKKLIVTSTLICKKEEFQKVLFILDRDITLQTMDPRKTADEIESAWSCGCKKTIDGKIIQCANHRGNPYVTFYKHIDYDVNGVKMDLD